MNLGKRFGNFSSFLDLKGFLKEERAQSEWSSVYLLLVLIIAALVLISVVKPMFQQSQKVVKKTEEKLITPANV